MKTQRAVQFSPETSLMVNYKFSAPEITWTHGWWSITRVWIVATAENRWQRTETRKKRERGEGVIRRRETREREGEREEDEERKNGPVPQFGLETLITQDHRLWQSNLLGCCLKNNHKRPAATNTHTHTRREMGIKWSREMKGQAKEKKCEAMEMKEGYGCMQKRLKWKESRTVRGMDESVKSRRSVRVMGGLVEVADGKIMIEKNKRSRAENKQKKEGYLELKAQSRSEACTTIFQNIVAPACDWSILTFLFIYLIL